MQFPFHMTVEKPPYVEKSGKLGNFNIYINSHISYRRPHLFQK